MNVIFQKLGKLRVETQLVASASKENAEFKYYTLYKHKLKYFVGVSL